MAFHTIVCIKSVMRAASKGAGRRTPENSELNPFDRPALEAALQLKDEQGGSVTALSMGPAVATEALVEARAMGVDRAVLLCDAALAGSDTYVTSRVLAEAARRLSPFDFLLFGTRAADSDTGQVGPQTATAMEIPFVSGVRRMIPAGERWQAERLMD
ncbi:MAG: electron transfer flavoprotein subunit beta/FixA family protein, partial [Desulfatitalea sp.]|nr:electron transfer flavoprotein subunit beta/FixA family protein [Desulfatitalea sp.]NNK01658.1 electron transfer flavoprotein subunit beta/FixA family protein [Desulfatitalea sp.]